MCTTLSCPSLSVSWFGIGPCEEAEDVWVSLQMSYFNINSDWLLESTEATWVLVLVEQLLSVGLALKYVCTSYTEIARRRENNSVAKTGRSLLL